MEISSSPQSAASQAAPPSRAEQINAAAAARTDLSPEAAVQRAEPVRFEPHEEAKRRAALDEALRSVERHLAIDPKTRDVVVQTVDPHTGKVIEQIPDETLLKLRVYARELRDAEHAGASEGPRRATKLA